MTDIVTEISGNIVTIENLNSDFVSVAIEASNGDIVLLFTVVKEKYSFVIRLNKAIYDNGVIECIFHGMVVKVKIEEKRNGENNV